MASLDDLEPGLDAVSALVDPVRRAAYRVVAGAGTEPLGRDEVAAELGIGRTLAAFHLDKLVDAGLLTVTLARRSGRSGPGAGRPAKLYRRAPGEHVVSVPPRAYRTGAELLAETVLRLGGEDTLFEVAGERGRTAGAAVAPGADLLDVLHTHGYAPAAGEETVRLRNCPFHQLADEFPPVVCGMNLALLSGLLVGAGRPEWRARLDPLPGLCCVVLERRGKGAAEGGAAEPL
ncbi:helix-turn-helix transcriptional regulator [Plantactinospora sp. WMMB334]|uniref:helix-turn-helix transcriptional regulator n=1 Tax=Plantactinospora sp. WMMB334 TaxID=3404119 RepID=UPI003B9405F4